MPTLLLRFAGPLQSWGTTSRFDERDTDLVPSKSGVVGLLCAALGRDRAEPVDDLAALAMGVRVDRAGTLLRDFQTASGAVRASGAKSSDPVVSPRMYLADASFLVGFEGDRSLLRACEAALRAPRWPLFLGRRSCPPGLPLLPAGDAIVEQVLRTALLSAPFDDGLPDAEARRVSLVIDGEDGELRMDQPAGPFSERRFSPRRVRTEIIDVPAPDRA